MAVPDLIINDKSGQLVAVVEVKNRQDLTPDLAAKLRRNLLAHDALPQSPYFLLLSQEKGYLWTPKEEMDIEALPAYEFSMLEVLNAYLSEELTGRRLRGDELEIVVSYWLSDFTGPDSHSQRPQSIRKIFERSGLEKVLTDGRVFSRAA